MHKLASPTPESANQSGLPQRAHAPRPRRYGSQTYFGNQAALRFSRTAPRIQTKLQVGATNDPLEAEADQVADRVMRMTDSSITAGDSSPVVRRMCPECKKEMQEGDKVQRKESSAIVRRVCTDCKKDEEDKQQNIQRKSASVGDSGGPAPESVHQVLSSPGRPLAAPDRAFFEPRLGADLSAVRIHDDSRAADSARSIGARAYTHGSHLAFAGPMEASSDSGRRLLAHELAHVAQQGNGPARIQRACKSGAYCATPSATLTNFVATTESKPENVSKADKRKKLCGTAPPDPKCTSDGHGALAPALTAILQANFPSRLGNISGIFVNKDMPADYGAVTFACSGFTPPLRGGTCTFVPDVLEAQAKDYQRGAQTVGGSPRATWLTATLGTLTHETEHARFDASLPIAEPSPTACKFADFQSNLSEMAAHLSEMHVYYRAALALPDKNRYKQFYQMFDYWVKNGSEDISGIVKDLRCKCECSDADQYITKTAESVSSNQKWDTNELTMIHTELRNPKWGLDWPVTPPAAVNVADLPTVAPAPLKLE